MKTIIRKDSNASLYLLDDLVFVSVDADKTTVGNPVQFYVSDCNTSNSTLFEGVTQPEDWTGNKYLYTAEGGWVLNPNWTPPKTL